MSAYDRAVRAIESTLSQRRAPIVVALDGGSGASKSTLAVRIADVFDVALVPIDDFFSADITDAEWDAFTVEERLKHVFDWQRLRETAIEPLVEGQPARWYALDFASGRRSDGTYSMEQDPKKRQLADVILIERAYAASPELADLIDLAILVDVPLEERHARLRAREDEGFLEVWHRRWDDVEEHYFTHVRPPTSFDLVVGAARVAR